MTADIFRQIFLLLIGFIYVGLGIYIFWKRVVDSPWSEVLGVLFILFGMWRVYRALTKK